MTNPILYLSTPILVQYAWGGAKNLLFKCSPSDSDGLGTTGKAQPSPAGIYLTGLPGLSGVGRQVYSYQWYLKNCSHLEAFLPGFLWGVLIWHCSLYNPGMLARAYQKTLLAHFTSLFTSLCSL